MTNKNLFRKVGMRKIHKSWIVMSLALLTAIGGGTFAAHADTNQNANNSNGNPQNNNAIIKSSNQKPAVTLVGATQQSSGSEATQSSATSSASSTSQSQSFSMVNFSSPQNQSTSSMSSSAPASSMSSSARYQALKSTLASAISTRGSYITNAISNDVSIMHNSSANSSEISMASSNAQFMESLSSKATSYEASLNGSLSPASQSDAAKYIPDWNRLNPQTRSKVARLLDDDFQSYDEPINFSGDSDIDDITVPVAAGKHIRVLKRAQLHSSAEFSQGRSLGVIDPNATMQVLKVARDHAGFTRYLVNVNGMQGYITANPYFTKEAYMQSSNQNFYVKVHKSVNVYSNPNFSNKVNRIRRGQVVKVLRVVSFGGITRLELTNGQYITANLGWVNTNR